MDTCHTIGQSTRPATGCQQHLREARRILAALSAYRVYFQVVQIILAVVLIVFILLQARGAGLGSVFGGTGTVFKTRRGIERTLFNMTIVIAILFALLSFFNAAIPAA
jgi:preprotein translocase subunit SecG